MPRGGKWTGEELQLYLLSNWNYIFKNAPLDMKLPGNKKPLLHFIEGLLYKLFTKNIFKINPFTVPLSAVHAPCVTFILSKHPRTKVYLELKFSAWNEEFWAPAHPCSAILTSSSQALLGCRNFQCKELNVNKNLCTAPASHSFLSGLFQFISALQKKSV